MNVEDRLERINDRGDALEYEYKDLAEKIINEHHPALMGDILRQALVLACRGQATLEFKVADLELEIAELKERLI